MHPTHLVCLRHWYPIHVLDTSVDSRDDPRLGSQPACDIVTNLTVGCNLSATTTVTFSAFWLASNYTAWMYMFVNNLPRVVT